MKAVRCYGKHELRVEDVPESRIEDAHDAIVKIEMGAVCGSDLHIYNNQLGPMKDGDILGHEAIGEIVAVGSEVRRAQVGDRVVVHFPISCGTCFFCTSDLPSMCEVSNPHADIAEKLWGQSTGGVYGYSQTLGVAWRP